MRQILNRLIEPKNSIPKEKQFIDTKALLMMMMPLMVEQFLQMVVGIADSMISSHAGQEVISGVSLVTTIYTVFIFLFTGIATGGGVVVSHALGRNDTDAASGHASRSFTLAFLFSLICMVLMLIFGDAMLQLIYGKVEAGIMDAAQTYLRIVALSFPANALYNAGASLNKTLGKTKVTMFISIAINLINIVGDYIGVFILHKGAAGVAWPTTISWYVAAILIFAYSLRGSKGVRVRVKDLFKPDPACVREILDVALPSAAENGLFQLAKVVLAAVIATFGTAQIAANGIGQTLWNMTALVGIAIGPVFIAVVGQAVGAGDREVADYYLIKLTKMTTLLSTVWNLLATLLIPAFLLLYSASEETLRLVVITTVLHNVFTGLVSPLALTTPNGYKAAMDLKFPLYASLICTCGIRCALTFFLGITCRMGIVGYMCAMCTDWSVKAVMVWTRYRSGKWYRAEEAAK